MAERKGKKAKQTEEVQTVSYDMALLSDDDLYILNEGAYYRLYEKLGVHPRSVGGVEGTYLAAWVPNTKQVSVIDEFNGWNKSCRQLRTKGKSGIWEGSILGVGNGTLYKYYIVFHNRNYCMENDPFPLHGRPYFIAFTLPPLSTVFFKNMEAKP